MSKTRRWVIILLSLVALVLIGVNLADRDDTVVLGRDARDVVGIDPAMAKPAVDAEPQAVARTSAREPGIERRLHDMVAHRE